MAISLTCVYIIALIVGKTTRKPKVLNVLYAIAPWVYLIIIALFLLFNRTEASRQIRLSFESWTAGAEAYHESNIIMFAANFTLFFPFGFLLQWRFKDFILSGSIVVIVGFTMEALQFAFARGVASLSDFVAYSLGGIMGVLCTCLIRCIRHRISKKRHLYRF